MSATTSVPASAAAPASHDVGATLAEILDGSVRTFVVHRSARCYKRLDEVFTELDTEVGAKLGLGVSVPLGHVISSTAKSFMSKHSNVPLRIVDPELHWALNSEWLSPQNKRTKGMAKWSFLDEVPTKRNLAWTRTVLDVQREHGATVLLSASGWVSDSKPQVQLDRAMALVRDSRASAGESTPMMVNLAFSWRWLVESDLRDMLLGEVLESREKLWHLRFYWPPLRGGGRPQRTDPALLDGYRELSRTLALEGRRLFLPISGLTGWLSTALGATGFSVGGSWSDQQWAEAPIFRNKKGAPAPVEIDRVFDPLLVHTIEFAEFQRLEAFAGHKRRRTSFLKNILSSGYDKETAALHYLTSVGRLQARLSTSANARRSALRRIDDGAAFIDTLPAVRRPAGPNEPVHYNAWKVQLTKRAR